MDIRSIMDRYGLNDEQAGAVGAGALTIVNASAGAGKTRCLTTKIRMLLDSGEQPSSILAVTFTNKAAKEMKERIKKHYPDCGSLRVSQMQISTIHSLCVRVIKQFPKHTPLKVPFSIYDDADQQTVVKTILKARKMDETPWDVLSAISRAKGDGNTDALDPDMARVYKAYQGILIANNACDFDDLLVYAASCLKHDDCREYFRSVWKHILIDEFQDTSAVQYEIILSLYDVTSTKTMFCVGDLNQCAIKGTLVKTNQGSVPIETINAWDKLQVGLGNGTIGESTVLNAFTKSVQNLPVVTITTTAGHQLTTTPEHSHFAEYTVDSPPLFFTYLMYKKGYGYRVGVTSMVRERGKVDPMLGYKARLSQERADSLWLLGSFSTKAEAQYHEQFYSVKYGIPTWVFYTTDKKGSVYDDPFTKKLFHEINTEKSALCLLKDLGMFHEYPHHIPRCLDPQRNRTFTIYLCGSIRNKDRKKVNIDHCYSISGSDLHDAEILKNLGLRIRSSNDRKGYRCEGVKSNIEDIMEIIEKIKTKFSINVLIKGRFSNCSLPIIPASHVLPGMKCFIERNGEIVLDTISSVKKDLYTGTIHDLNIKKVHNFIANGIVTHNSVYGWRQARPENMQEFITKYKPTICNLTYNYRSCSPVIAHANQFLQFGPPMVAKSGTAGTVATSVFANQEDEARLITEAIEKMGNYQETVILYRTNARSILFERALAVKRIPYKVVGDLPFYKRKVVKDLLSYCKAAANLSDMESLVRIVNIPKRGFGEAKQEALLLEGRGYFDTMAEEMPEIRKLKELLETSRSMPPMAALDAIIGATGYRSTLDTDANKALVDTLLDVVAGFSTLDELVLSSTFLEEDSGHGVRLMSAHASKGLEFDRVFVVGVEDGVWPHKLSLDVLEEERLFYVACSRARRYLNVSYSRSKLARGKPIPMYPSNLYVRSREAIAPKVTI